MLDIIGGTDLYKLDGLDIHERLGGDTPFGTPSGEVLRGTLYSQPVLFLTRYSADVPRVGCF
jgi:purine nucleoside phosphorylase